MSCWNTVEALIMVALIGCAWIIVVGGPIWLTFLIATKCKAWAIRRRWRLRKMRAANVGGRACCADR